MEDEIDCEGLEIEECTKQQVHIITCNDGHEYKRFGSESWFITYGSSDEEMYFCEGIEAVFQEYIKKDMK